MWGGGGSELSKLSPLELGKTKARAGRHNKLAESDIIIFASKESGLLWQTFSQGGVRVMANIS